MFRVNETNPRQEIECGKRAKLIRSRAGGVRPWAKFRFALLCIAHVLDKQTSLFTFTTPTFTGPQVTIVK